VLCYHAAINNLALRGIHRLRSALWKQRPVGYLSLFTRFAGVVLTLLSVRELGQRAELRLDRYWHGNNLIAKVHSLLSEVAL